MSKWIQVFRGKERRKDQERWACCGCGATFEGNHNQTRRMVFVSVPSVKATLGTRNYIAGITIA